MDFRLADEQLALQSTVRSFCADRLSLTEVATRDGGAGPAVWDGLADLGVFDLLSEGSDAPAAVEAAVVFEALGYYLAPGPTLWSAVAAAFVPGIAEGRRKATGVDATMATARVVVPHAAQSDDLVVIHADHVQLVTLEGLSGVVAAPLDPLTPCNGYDELPVGERVGDARVAGTMRLRGAMLAAAMQVGLAQGALDAARSYALEREQFGVAIGSFQAIKHLLADMFVKVELARSATYAAAATVANPRSGDAARATSAAKVLAGEAANANSRSAIQILGGMGFTWEMLPHYYLKRAWVLENTFGTGVTHSLALAAAVEAEAVA